MKVSLAFLVAFSCALTAGWLSVRRASLTRSSKWHFVAICSAMVVAVVSVSALPAYRWLTEKYPYHVGDDFTMSQRGKELARVTEPGASIATTWAGAPAYYAQRPMLDLLGKSDRRIATGPPKTPVGAGWWEVLAWFYPGHNKWDHPYSIGELRPDVVFQIYGGAETARQLSTEWGYIQKCLSDGTPIHVRLDSTLVRLDALTACPVVKFQIHRVTFWVPFAPCGTGSVDSD